ncbi:hypothetical protein M0R45_038233 [Rubus argutus]|uniref:Seven-in-absentia protein TRAF-like domain-containing protein n=1 Tax=Rubus argutus TaxID=59490 RepID=A0AAW1W6K2_RUBAR
MPLGCLQSSIVLVNTFAFILKPSSLAWLCLYGVSTFMGDENEARNYSYSLEVGANGRKLIWEGTPRSVRDSHRKELKLRVTGRIWKEQQNPDSGVCIPNLCS